MGDRVLDLSNPKMARPKKWSLKPETKKRNYYLDVSECIKDNIVELEELETFFKTSMKIGPHSKKEHGEMLTIKRQDTTGKILFTVRVQMHKRYIKYLAKKFLKKAQLRDYVRIVADPKNKHGFNARYLEVEN